MGKYIPSRLEYNRVHMGNPPKKTSERLETLKTVRHSIKNDLSVIIAFAQLVKLNPQDKKAAEFLEKIEQRAGSILKTVENYLTKDTIEDTEETPS